MSELHERHCVPCEGGASPLDDASARRALESLHDDWKLIDGNKAISRTFEFRNYYQTTAFVNAVAWIAHREDHHPDMEFGYRECVVTWSTHAINGLSDNDMICAAKVDQLVAEHAPG